MLCSDTGVIGLKWLIKSVWLLRKFSMNEELDRSERTADFTQLRTFEP